MNPKLVQQYALQTDAELNTVGKIAVLKDKKLLPLIEFNKIYTLEDVKSLENAKKISDSYSIPLDTFLAFLWEPGLTPSQVKKLVSDAHTSILGAMQL